MMMFGSDRLVLDFLAACDHAPDAREIAAALTVTGAEMVYRLQRLSKLGLIARDEAGHTSLSEAGRKVIGGDE